MSEAAFEQATLQLKLYDLRREPKLREARNGFPIIFHPQSLDDVMRICPRAAKRMPKCAGPHVLGDGCEHVQSRPSERGPPLRKYRRRVGRIPASEAGVGRLARNVRQQEFLGNLEAHCARLEAWREKTSPGSNAAIRKVIAQMHEAKQGGKP